MFFVVFVLKERQMSTHFVHLFVTFFINFFASFFFVCVKMIREGDCVWIVRAIPFNNKTIHIHCSMEISEMKRRT